MQGLKAETSYLWNSYVRGQMADLELNHMASQLEVIA